MNLLAGKPKTMKSTMALAMGAAIADGMAVRNYRMRDGRRSVAKQRRTVIYLAYEQSAGRLRHAYEKRIIKRSLKQSETHFILLRQPWEWQLDSEDNEVNLIGLMKDLKPALIIVDPLVHAHSQDENDPKMIRPLVPVREKALALGIAILLVHHMNKRKSEDGSSRGGDFDNVRGTSALWGMVDSGHLVTKTRSGGLLYTSDFKDFKSREWSWRAP